MNALELLGEAIFWLIIWGLIGLMSVVLYLAIGTTIDLLRGDESDADTKA